MGDILRESYDRDADRYDATFGEIQRTKYEALLGSGHSLRPVLSSGFLLDLGCGTGLLGGYLKERGLPVDRLAGLDISFRMLEKAGDRLGFRCQGRVETLPFCSESFGAVCAFTVLRILPVPDEPILNEVARVLKPEGLFIVSILERNADRTFEENLGAAGFQVQTRRSCGQDRGFLCRKR